MLIKRDWTRRSLLKTGAVLGTAGVLQPVLKLLESGKTIEAAYPEEMLSIETYTKGKVKPGMVISKDNAELVKDICPEGLYVELTRGRRIKIKETTTDITQYIDPHWIEVSLRNKGQAVLDNNNQLWTKDHKPWIGGSPFPEPKNGYEMAWNHIFNFYRADDDLWVWTSMDIHQGRLVRKTVGEFWQIQTVGRVWLDPKPGYPNFSDSLYRQNVLFTEPFDLFGLQVLSVIFYDGTKLPEEIVYVPALRRLRRVASEARFEPTFPQGTPWPSEHSIHNDPILTSTWTLVGKKPMLQPAPTNTGPYTPGGASENDFVFPMCEKTYPPSTWELRPEIWLMDGVSHIPGCPLSKKRLYIDSATLRASMADGWDKTGNIWRTTVFFISPLHYPGIDGRGKDVAVVANALWFGDVQADTYSNIWQVPERVGFPPVRINGGFKVEELCTPDALLRMARR